MTTTLTPRSAPQPVERDNAGSRVGASPPPSFRPDIEGMRAVAVGTVVLSHAGVSAFSGGYIGVDVFFVISGFLITSLLLKELDRTGTISIVGFYARRATRILPMATVVVGATIAAAWLWLPPIRFGSIVDDAVASSLYAVNYQLAVQDTDYLNADEPPSPFQQYWSLAVEEQFYLVWPLLLLAVALVLRRRRWLISTVLTTLLGIILSVSFAASVLLTADSPTWSYFGAHTRAWELAAGALTALAVVHMSRMNRALAAALTWGGLAMVVFAALRFDEATVFPGYAAAIPVAGTVAVIAGGCATPRLGAQALLGTRVFQTVGKLSYGFYLWHWPVLMIGPAALNVNGNTRVNLTLVAAAFGITALTYEIIENPIRFAKWFKRPPIRGVGLGLGLTACAVAGAFVAGATGPSTVGSGTAVDTRQNLTDDTLTTESLNELIAHSSKVDDVPVNLTPELTEAKADNPVIYDNDCHASVVVVEVDRSCVFGDPDGDKSVVLFGDSHAANWFPALDRLSGESGWRFISLTKSACPSPIITKVSAQTDGGVYHQCDQWRENALRYIAEVNPALVVLASSEGNNPVDGDPDQGWIDGWAALVDRVHTDTDSEVVVIADTPRFDEDVPDCVSAHLSDVTSCNVSLEDGIREPERQQVVQQNAKNAGATVIDPNEWFCANGTCSVIVGNVLAYRDAHHFTATYSEFLAPLLAQRLPEI